MSARITAEREVEHFVAQQDFFRRMGCEPTVIGRGEGPLRARLAEALEEIEEAGEVSDERDRLEREVEELREDLRDVEADRDLLRDDLKAEKDRYLALADECDTLRAKLASVESAQTERPVGVQRSKPRKP